jgi:hypothetical protein
MDAKNQEDEDGLEFVDVGDYFKQLDIDEEGG